MQSVHGQTFIFITTQRLRSTSGLGRLCHQSADPRHALHGSREGNSSGITCKNERCFQPRSFIAYLTTFLQARHIHKYINTDIHISIGA